MTNDIISQGPDVYIPLMLISLAITLVIYGAFPVIFAKLRRKDITAKKYTLICFLINFLIYFVFFFGLGNSTNTFPYFLWTSVFTATGKKIMRKREVLKIPGESETTAAQENSICTNDSFVSCTANVQPQPKLSSKPNRSSTFCRYCGGAVDSETKKCSICGKQYFSLRIFLKWLIVIIICILLCFMLYAVSSFGYTQEDLDTAYQQGFDAGYEMGYNAPKPVDMPKSGEILSGKKFAGSLCSRLQVSTKESACVVSVKNSKGMEQITFFVRPNTTITVLVPAIKLNVFFASGTTWYGYEEGLMFGNETVYTKDDELLDFNKYSFSYALYPVDNRNYAETPSTQEEFFK